MELTLDQALQKGIEAHKAGKVQEADRLYTAILKANPKHPDANHNMGVLAVGVDKVEAALTFFKTALELNPNIAQYWLSYIDALIKLDRIAEAKAVLDQAKSSGAKGDGFDQLEKQLVGREKGQEPTQRQVQPLIDLYSQGQHQETINLALQLQGQFPNSINLHNIIGAANQSLGNLDKAIEAYNKALSIKPDYADAYFNIGRAFQDQGKLDEAIEAYNKVLSIKPNYAEAHYSMGVTLQSQDKLEEAIEDYTKALSLKPDYADAYNNMGSALYAQGKLDEAIEAYTKAIAIKPDNAEAYNNMGVTLKEKGKLDEAIEAYTKAIAIKPDNAEALNNMGVTLKEKGKLDEAIEAYNKALAIKPDNAEALNNMGVTLKEKGELDEAIEAYNKALAIKPDYANVHRNLSTLTKYTPDSGQISTVDDLLQRQNLNESDRCNFHYTYAKMKEDLGDLSVAFDNFVAGGALRKKLLSYESAQDKNLFSKIKNTAAQFKNISLDLSGEAIRHTPFFILGMPRSGTTLVEQIVSLHSEITGAGELAYVSQFGGQLAAGLVSPTLEAVSAFRKRYLAELAKRANGLAFITDKMPQNFRYIALICTAFPEAKIVHVQRSAEATCWSNFKHYFTSKSLGYSYDLGDIVDYYGLYKDLMHFWSQSYSDRIYNLDYDKLTENQEPQTLRLIEYLELNWEDACLAPQNNNRSVKTASQQQVRQKVYKGSSQAWRKYEPFLDGVFDGLKVHS